MKQKKRIVHIISNLEIGGAQQILYELITRLEEFDHLVIYFRHGPFYDRFVERGIPVYAINGLISLYDPVFFMRLFRRIKQLNPPLIHTVLWAASMSGSLVARLLAKPYIISLHNNLSLNGRMRRMIDMMFQTGSGGSFAAVSSEVARSAQRYFIALSKPAITVIENGIDCSFVKDNKKSRTDVGLAHDHFIIGTVGRFDAVKNHALLIDSFALFHQQYKQGRLIIIGSGPLEYQLREHIKKRNLEQVVYLLIGKRAVEWYHLFDVFVQTSKTEGISLALLEAMASRVTCVVVGTDHEVIKNQHNGILIASTQPHSLSTMYEYLLHNPLVAKQLAIHAQVTISERFALETMLARYKHLFL